ncbi:MAG: sugar ABC transporter permease, partial [Clostridia bacterium]
MGKTTQFSGMSRALVRRETTASYLFLLPFLLFFSLFVIVPMAMCLFTSFFNYTMSDFTFVGLQNFKELFTDPIFLRSLKNTLLIVLVSVPVVMVFSLWAGSSLYTMNKFSQAFFRCVFYLPVVTGTVAVTVVWKWMFNQYTGLLNYMFKSLGMITQNVSWLGDKDTAIWCIITILFTTSIGQPIVLYISALGNVDNSIIEA